MENGRRAIEELVGRSDFGNFAFPFGDVTLNAKKMVGQDVASSRGICSGLNGPEVDLNLLRANSLYGDTVKCSQVRKLVLENERQLGWLIFYLHDVRRTPSRYGCTPELLEFAVSFASKTCARILTVAEVVAELVWKGESRYGFLPMQAMAPISTGIGRDRSSSCASPALESLGNEATCLMDVERSG